VKFTAKQAVHKIIKHQRNVQFSKTKTVKELSNSGELYSSGVC